MDQAESEMLTSLSTTRPVRPDQLRTALSQFLSTDLFDHRRPMQWSLFYPFFSVLKGWDTKQLMRPMTAVHSLSQLMCKTQPAMPPNTSMGEASP